MKTKRKKQKSQNKKQKGGFLDKVSSLTHSNIDCIFTINIKQWAYNC